MGLRNEAGDLIEADDQECVCCGELIPERGGGWLIYAEDYWLTECFKKTPAGQRWLATQVTPDTPAETKEDLVAKAHKLKSDRHDLTLLDGELYGDTGLVIDVDIEGGNLVLNLSESVDRIAMNKGEASLLRDCISLKQKQLGQQKVK